MIETVLTLPFVLLLLLMILFYGWSMTRLQRASVQDRYEAWRIVYHGEGPRTWRDPDGSLVTVHINDAFWAGNALSLDGSTSSAFPNDVRDTLMNEAAGASNDAGIVAEDLLETRLPHGRRVSFETDHDTRSPVLDRIGSQVRHSHTRIGNEWKYANGVRLRNDGVWVETDAPSRVTPGDMVRDQFMIDMDRPLEQIDNGQWDHVARVVRWYYRGFPPYRGPDVDYHLTP